MEEQKQNLQEAFNDMLKAIGLESLPINSDQYQAMKNCFFNGAMFTFYSTIIYDENVLDTDEKIIQNLNDFKLEIDNFRESFSSTNRDLNA